MKKLELKFGSIKEMLTKDQMKQISGGSSSCGASHGGSVYLYEPCSGDVCACQDYWDGQCEQDNYCDDIDCGCK